MADIFHRALSKLLTEILDGPPGKEAYLLNPGDPGLLKELDTIDAATASSRPMPGRTTIAAHVDHVNFGFSLMNRWAAGEPNPFEGADWSASWKRGKVDAAAWDRLRKELKQNVQIWQRAVAARTEWDDISAAGALSSAAHTAYHLGAIRQILAAQGKHQPTT